MSSLTMQPVLPCIGYLPPEGTPPLINSIYMGTYSDSSSPSKATSHYLSDDILMGEVLMGADWALEQLYTRYYRYAYQLAYHILQENSAAEDIVQEVFLSVWRKAALYKHQHGSFLLWLKAIIHHRSIDKVRTAAHRYQQLMPFPGTNELDIACQQPDVWEEAWRNEQQRILHATLQLIPLEQRIVIECCYFKGMTHLEISRLYQLPLGTVKGRLRLGLRKLKLLLQERELDLKF